MIRSLFERWLRIRNKQDAMRIKRRFAIVYAIVGWHVFGVAFYTIMKRTMPEDPQERRAALKHLSGASNMHVYQITGLTVTNEFDVKDDVEVDQLEKEKKEERKNTIVKKDQN